MPNASWQIYVNGRVVEVSDEFPNNAGVSLDEYGQKQLMIGGAILPNTTRHFTGMLDDIRIWNAVRRAEEIADNYTIAVEIPGWRGCSAELAAIASDLARYGAPWATL